MSSLGWLGWTRMPSTPRWPIVLRQRVTTRTLLAASTRSLLLISLAAAAASSGVMPGPDRRQHLLGRGVVENPFAELADGQAAQCGEGVAVERLEDQPAHLVGVGIDQRVVDDLAERQVGQDQLGGDPLALGPRGQPGELVARLLLVGLGEDLAQVGEVKSLASDHGRQVHGSTPTTTDDRLRHCQMTVTHSDHAWSKHGSWSSIGSIRSVTGSCDQSGSRAFRRRAASRCSRGGCRR